VEVNGLAGQTSIAPGLSVNPSNRRISILLPFLSAPQPQPLEALKGRLNGG
jgi:hypothetical protein